MPIITVMPKKPRNIVSYDIHLPDNLNANLDKLFNLNKVEVNQVIKKYWNNKSVNEIKESTRGNIYLEKKLKKKPKHLPSRPWRNMLESAGRILKSAQYRKDCFNDCLKIIKTEETDWYKIKTQLHKETKYYPYTLVKNVVKSINNLKEKDPNLNLSKLNFFKVVQPEFRGKNVLLEIDDGQFRKITYYENKIVLDIKLPTEQGWQWFNKIELPLYQKIIDAKNQGIPVSPQLKIIERNGWKKYVLSLRIEYCDHESLPQERVLAIDQGTGTKSLAVVTVVDKENKDVNLSKPIYLKAIDLIKKIKRLKFHAERLQEKIKKTNDHIRRCQWKQQREQLWTKIRNLKKEILEILSNEILYLCQAFDCKEISLENLKWTDTQANMGFLSWLKSTWFYSQLEKKLKYKGAFIKVIVRSHNPKNTSRKCLKCNQEAKETKGRLVKCKNEHKNDRDFVGSCNLGKRALGIEDLYGFRCGVKCYTPLSAIIPDKTLQAYFRIIKIPNVNNCLYGIVKKC